MRRREFVQVVGAVSASGLIAGCDPKADTTSGADTKSPDAGSAAARAKATGTEAKATPDWAQHRLDSDMQGLGPDGKPTGQKATFTGASKANATAEESATHQMTLTAVMAMISLGLCWSPFALAQEEEAQAESEQPQADAPTDAVAKALADPLASADETAKALANPAGSLANLANNLTYRTFKGDLPDAGSQTAVTYTFQPVLPFPVGDKGRNIIVRPAMTVSFDQPVFDSSTGTWDTLSTEFNDITFDTVYAGTTMTSKSTGYLWGIGVAGTIPTASHRALGGEQWRLGPEFFGGIIRDWGVMGGLVSNQWNLGGGGGGPGSGDEPYSTTTAQYFYGIGLGGGWQILSGPVITYDWKAPSGERLSLPLGTGIAKTTKIGDTTWRFQIELQYYIEQPDSFGSDWSLTFDFRPVIQNPVLKWFQ